MVNDVLFEVPAQLLQSYEVGNIQRVGTLLVDSSSRQIVAHMQETSGFSQIASLAINTPAKLLGANPLSLLSQGVTVVQNEQIKNAISTLQALQMGTMVLSGVGIGISVAGFTLISKKIDRLDTVLASVSEELEMIAIGVADLKSEVLYRDLDALRTECQQVDEAYHLSDPDSQWRSAAKNLHHLQNRFHRRALQLLQAPSPSLSLLNTLVEAFVLSGSARVTARMAAGDISAARNASKSMSQELNELTGNIGVPNFIAKGVSPKQQAPAEIVLQIEAKRQQAENQTAAFRDREAIAATTSITIEALENHDISPREWLEKTKAEQSQPLALLLLR